MNAIAFLFPGQGAQAVGMGKAFYDGSEDAKEVYREANRCLGYDLKALCFEGPQEELTRTDRCQPALLVTAVAAYRALRQLAPTLKPQAMAGLSLGEITALTVAEAFSFRDALYLVQTRGEAMVECAAHHPGAMLAVVGLSEEAVRKVCEGSGAYAANFNSEEQTVLSGTAEAITKAEVLAKEQGAKRVLRLEVSGAFHSPLMQPAADKLKAALEKIAIGKPTVPIVSNVTAKPTTNPDEIRRLLVQQIVSPVLWYQSIRRLTQAGITHFIEFPPAKVLTALLRRIDKDATAFMLNEPADVEKTSSAVVAG